MAQFYTKIEEKEQEELEKQKQKEIIENKATDETTQTEDSKLHEEEKYLKEKNEPVKDDL